MIKAKLSFFWTSSSEGHGSHGNNGTILILDSVNVPMSVISTKLYFVEISWGHKKLWIFKCTMLTTLNSDFLDWRHLKINARFFLPDCLTTLLLFVLAWWEYFLKISRKCVCWEVKGFSFRLNEWQQYCARNYEKKCKQILMSIRRHLQEELRVKKV